MRNDYVQDDFDDFDDFEPLPRRRRIFSRLLAMMVLGGFVGFGAYIYTDGDRIESGKPPSIIQKAENPFKVKPKDPGGMNVPHRDKTVYESLLAGRDKKERQSNPRLSAPPEEPIVASQANPAEQAARIRPATPEIEAPLLPDDIADSVKAQGNVSTEVASIGTGGSVMGASERGSPPSASVVTTDLSGEIRVQLASLRTDGAVKRAWTRMRRDFPDLLGDLALSVVRSDLGAERGVFYRMQVGPLESADSARSLCGKIRARRRECLVVKP